MTDKSLRIVADHGRAVTFMIADGILPSNEGRGYVLRRLLRRAVYHGRLLGIEGAFLSQYAHEVTNLLGATYTELVEQATLVDGILAAEEERFGATLDAGEAMLSSRLAALEKGSELSGEIAFTLHDTYGFPIDLTVEIAEQAGHHVAMDAFHELMEAQRERARETAHKDAWGTANTVWTALSEQLEATSFVGYDQDECETRVVALVQDGKQVERAHKGDELEVILAQTPFYAEMGGQVGDTGELVGSAQVTVLDTHAHQGLYAHKARIEEGELAVGDTVVARIATGRRELIRRNHTATHLLDQALKDVLGDHVHQAGSLVAPDRLRFDFTHFEALTKDQLDEIEGQVNAAIIAAYPVETQVMSLARTAQLAPLLCH